MNHKKIMRTSIILIVVAVVVGLGLVPAKAEDGKVDIVGGNVMNHLVEVPVPSGWDDKGKFKEGDSCKFCSITSETG